MRCYCNINKITLLHLSLHAYFLCSSGRNVQIISGLFQWNLGSMSLTLLLQLQYNVVSLPFFQASPFLADFIRRELLATRRIQASSDLLPCVFLLNDVVAELCFMHLIQLYEVHDLCCRPVCQAAHTCTLHIQLFTASNVL